MRYVVSNLSSGICPSYGQAGLFRLQTQRLQQRPASRLSFVILSFVIPELLLVIHLSKISGDGQSDHPG